jgi:hypothetical protein
MDAQTLLVIVLIILFWGSLKLIRNQIDRRIKHYCKLDNKAMEEELEELNSKSASVKNADD